MADAYLGPCQAPLIEHSEVVALRCSVKKVFLETSQNSQEKKPVQESLF